MRIFVALVALVAALAVGASTALATTGTGEGGLKVSVSLTATTQGASITVAESITNTLRSRQFVKVTQTLSGPGGRVFSFSYPIILGPSKALAFNFTFTLPAFVPDGVYTLTLTANTASASATTTVA